MKTNTPMSWFMTGLTAVAIVAAPAAVPSIQSQPALFADEGERQELITGLVKKISDKELSVTHPIDETKETNFKLTKETKYLKDGKPAKREDLSEGARVSVKATKTFLGGYEAGEVELLTANPPAPTPAG
jgi:hypothetical protein